MMWDCPKRLINGIAGMKYIFDTCFWWQQRNGLLCTICLTVKNVSDLGQRPTNYVRFYGNVERQNLGCGPFTTTEAFLYVFSLMD